VAMRSPASLIVDSGAGLDLTYCWPADPTARSTEQIVHRGEALGTP
jgi:hypothetical protein